MVLSAHMTLEEVKVLQRLPTVSLCPSTKSRDPETGTEERVVVKEEGTSGPEGRGRFPQCIHCGHLSRYF